MEVSMDFTIKQIEEACSGRLFLRGERGRRDLKVTSVVLDSRQAEENGVFVAVPGQKVDGHKFIGQVFKQGAALVITEKSPEQIEKEHGIEEEAWGSYLLVEDSLKALKEIAEAYRRTLSIPVVGITGSVGKTSTKEFIAGVLSQRFRVLKTEGNFNNEIGVPLTLLRIRKEHEAAVIEMGISDFGEMHRLSRMVRPDVCVMTNIGQCHLENLKDRDGILRAKSEIFDYMQENGEVCLYGGDDKLRTLQEIRGRKPHFFGLLETQDQEVYADAVISRGLWGSEARLHLSYGKEGAEFPVQVPLPGRHMVINACAAACVGKLFGLSPAEIAEGIAGVSPVGGRNHLLRLSHYTLIDDCYNANPVSMKAAIDLLSMADTEKTAVLGDMFELGEDSDRMHAEVGAYGAAAGLERIVCVGEKSRFMYEAAKKEASDKQRLFYFPNLEALKEALLSHREELIPEGSTALIKASHGMCFTDIVNMLSCS